MNMTVIKSWVKIAQIHEKHLLYALNHLAATFPIHADKVLNLNEQEFILIELLTSRFAKLQDFMGNKLINAVLEQMNEFSGDLTIIDKINKLEKFHLIKDAKLWQEFRQLRNHLSHEYPDNPELLAKYLNQTYTLSFELIECLNTLLKKLA